MKCCPSPSAVGRLAGEAEEESSAASTPHLCCDAQHPAADSSLGNSGNGDAWKDSFGLEALSKSGSRRQKTESRQFLNLQGAETEASLLLPSPRSPSLSTGTRTNASKVTSALRNLILILFTSSARNEILAARSNNHRLHSNSQG